ncbi:tetratricopeptide repeat protein [Zavarzinella formosa]|uniref:tetratricopeptide repeat protein n=1 Tax=Zavarzinella formosa TaxID=360055 RepID=UPI0003067C11|nr:hypothetical protein [Zavarzinella formosa]
MEIATADLAPIRELYGRGFYVQALRLAERFGPLTEWSNTPARLLGGRLAIQLGSARLGRFMHLRAYRDTPAHPEAIYYHARYRLEKFGPHAAWRFLRSHPDQDWNDAAPEIRADWYGLHAFVCGRMRDIDRAERWLAKAESLSHDRAWLCVEKAAVHEFADRLEEALASANRSIELVPHFRPGVQAKAHILQILGREREALDCLIAGCDHLESGIIAAHLAAVQMDLRMYSDARKTYERYAELSPLMDKETTKWLEARRADTAYYVGDFTAAKEHSRKALDEFYTAFADKLEQTPEPIPTVRIEMPPKKELKSIFEWMAGWWKITTPPYVADTQPGDGLPEARERQWAEQNGFAVAEFTYTQEACEKILARGWPCVVTMVDAGYGHSQVVCGGDFQRKTLWLADLSEPRVNEAPLKVILERYGTYGPRGFLMVPKDRAVELEALALPDTARYDRLHKVQSAIVRHDRALAQSVYETMRADEPLHRLTRTARFAIARYDANPTLLLHAIDSLLALAPEDNTALLAKLNVLRELNRRDERNELARRQSLRKEADPLFAHHHAQNLLQDPDRLEEARRVIRNAIRQRPYAPGGYYILGSVLWEMRLFQEATDAYRFAAALEDRDEQFAEAYFRAARALEQTPEAMRFLKTRFERLKGKAAGPARAMFYVLSDQEEMDAAFDLLEVAAKDTPGSVPSERADVMLFAAEMRTNYDEPEPGQQLLEQAKPLANKSSWARASARISLVRADLREARKNWETLLAEEPLSADLHRNISRAVADLEGRSAAIKWVRALCDRFSHHYPLWQLLIDWLRSEQVPDGQRPPAEPVLRHLLELCPDDASAHRELAMHLANHGHADEALAELKTAKALEPDHPSYFFTLGHAYRRADKPEQAREAYEEAIRRSADNEGAISELMNLAKSEEDKKEAIDFLADEFRRQRLIGDGLLVFREQAMSAHDAIEPDDLLRILQDISDEHPDIWQASSMLIQQLTVCGRIEEARELAKDAVERYPLLARLWVDLAEVAHAQEERDAQIDALRHAVEMSPGWSYPARELADALEANDQPEEARVVLEQAVARAPLDPVNHGYLADNLWNAEEPAEALRRLGIALRIDPGYDWAWRHLAVWSERQDEGDKAAEVARDVCRLRPGDPRGWLALARLLQGPANNEEVLSALDKAIESHPRGLEAYDLKAERLAEMGRFDEAKAAATPEVFELDPPLILQGRAAWVEAKRGNHPLACREMQALVTIEPTYYWGWQQLAEWYNETGRKEEFLDAADKLVELRPDNPMALAMRGEAKLQNDDREGAKADLKEAQQNEPGYFYAGMLLFDAHLHDAEYPQARAALAVLEEHVSDGGRAHLLSRYIQLATRTKDEEAAADAFRELLTLPSDTPWLIGSAANELRQVGWGEMADEILRETLEESDDYHPWVLMTWLDTEDSHDADPEDKLRIVNRVIETHPRYPLAYDVKAEILTRMGRYDEAVQTCHPKAWGDSPPQILRGRLAWITAQRGDRTAAIAAMRALLKADPEYSWGWRQLAEWHDQEESPAEFLEAAENLVRLSPTDPSAYVARGDAREASDDRRGAKSDYQEALRMDPAYGLAGLHLFELELGDNELDAAQRTLAVLEEHAGGPQVALAALRLHARRSDAEAARLSLIQVLEMEDVPYFMIARGVETLVNAGMADVADRALDQLLAAEEPGPTTIRLWVERSVVRGDWAFLDRLPAFIKTGEDGREALYATVDALGELPHRLRLHEVIQKFGDELRSSNRGWAKVTAALMSVNDYQTAVTWGADWKTRNVDEPWMLHPLVVCHRQLGQYSEARLICEAALKIPDEDATSGDFAAWLSFEEALLGNTEKARALFQAADFDTLDGLPRILYTLAEGLLLVREGGRASFEQAKQRAKEAIDEFKAEAPEADLKASYQRWVVKLAKDAGGIGPWLWAKFSGKKLP